jgi:NADPH:quinone reductase-like Zn-dependent oxidoreductase
MKAIAHDGYGPPDDLALREVDKPSIDDTGVLIRVRAAAVNPVDWHLMRGEPSFLRMMGGRNPVGRIPGSDVAGQVEAVRDHGRLQPGQSILINGAAGGVGTYAVQIAKALGGRVTGVCSTSNLEFVHSIGADDVIDYTTGDFTRSSSRYDLIVQLAGNRTQAELRRALTRDGHLVVVGGGTGREIDDGGGLWELLSLMLKGMVLSRVVRPRALMFMARIRTADLTFLAELIESGKLTSVVDRIYPLANAADAIRHLETGHARGKVIVTV